MKITERQEASIKATLSIFLITITYASSYYGTIVEFGLKIASFGTVFVAIDAVHQQRNKDHKSGVIRKIGAIMLSIAITCMFFPGIALILLGESIYSLLSNKPSSIVWALSKSIFYSLGINIKDGIEEFSRVMKSILKGKINPESRINIEYNQPKN